MSSKVKTVNLFYKKPFSSGETFVSDPIDISNANGLFSYHCIVTGSINLKAEVSLNGSDWVDVAGFDKNLSDTKITEPMDIPVSRLLRFKVTTSSAGEITLMFAYI